MPSAWKLITRSVAVIRRSIAGWASVNSASLGISHFEEKVGVTLIVTREGVSRSAPVASISWENARETAAW
tara:strand:- start:14174 stop:14386 length:213 start_codon:yes stop_codon:yes gene_type:complete